MRIIHITFMLAAMFQASRCVSQVEFNFGLNTGMYYNNTLANLEIHAFQHSSANNYSDPIRVGNGFVGFNIEYRKKLDDILDRFTYITTFNLQRSVFSGGGADSAGYNEKFNLKFRYSYLQLMGSEYLLLNDGNELALGLSCDVGLWKIRYRWDRASDPEPEYKKYYGAFQLGYTWWLRYVPANLENMQFLLSWHRAVLRNDKATYEYRIKFFSFALRYSLKT